MVLEGPKEVTEELETGSRLGKVLEGQGLVTNWPGTGDGLADVIEGQDLVTNSQRLVAVWAGCGS